MLRVSRHGNKIRPGHLHGNRFQITVRDVVPDAATILVPLIERLRRDGFGRRPYFQTLVCRQGRIPVGFALYIFTYSTFLARPTLYLEDLFVLPSYRRRGAGKMLLGALARIAVRRGCGRMEWAVLRINTPAIRFYNRLGATLRKEWILTRLAGGPLRHLARGVSRRRSGPPGLIATPR